MFFSSIECQLGKTLMSVLVPNKITYSLTPRVFTHMFFIHNQALEIKKLEPPAIKAMFLKYFFYPKQVQMTWPYHWQVHFERCALCRNKISFCWDFSFSDFLEYSTLKMDREQDRWCKRWSNPQFYSRRKSDGH